MDEESKDKRELMWTGNVIGFVWQVYTLHFDPEDDVDEVQENIIEKNLIRDPEMCLRMQRHFEEKEALTKIVGGWIEG